MLLDMHSHILPGVDDGSKSLEESIQLLTMMKEQGITHVIATPHFYPSSDAVEGFSARVKTAYEQLAEAVKGKNLPQILLGSEVLYYRYIGRSDSIDRFCLGNSSYLLLELSATSINNGLFDDLTQLMNGMMIKPIIAHIERYAHFPEYRKLIDFVKQNRIPAQINASSVLSFFEYRTVKHLIRQDIVTYIGTDAHSVEGRPPRMKEALDKLEQKFGKDYVEGLKSNSRSLYKQVTKGETDAEQNP